MPCVVIIVGSRRLPNTWYSSRPGQGDPSFKPAPMPTARRYLAATPLGPGLAGTFGGIVHDAAANNEVYDFNANAWMVRAPLPTARYALAAAPLGPGLAGTFGGVNDTGYLAINEVYDFNSNSWSTRAPMPTFLNLATAAPLGPGLVGAFGGRGGGGSVATTYVYSYNDNTWASRAPIPTVRAGAAAPLGPGLAGVFGGVVSNSSNPSEVYDYNADVWMIRAPAPTARNYLAATPLGPGLAGVFGGVVYTPYPTSTAANEIYDFNSNSWSTRAPMPTARGYLAAAPLGPGLAGTFGGSGTGARDDANEIYSY